MMTWRICGVGSLFIRSASTVHAHFQWLAVFGCKQRTQDRQARERTAAFVYNHEKVSHSWSDFEFEHSAPFMVLYDY